MKRMWDLDARRELAKEGREGGREEEEWKEELKELAVEDARRFF